MVEIAIEGYFENPLERGTVACQSRADAIDQRHDLWIVAEVQHVGVPPATCCDYAVLEDQALGFRFQRPLLQPVRCVVEQLAGRLDGTVEHMEKMLLDKADMTVLALRQQLHQPIQIPSGRGAGEAQGNQAEPYPAVTAAAHVRRARNRR